MYNNILTILQDTNVTYNVTCHKSHKSRVTGFRPVNKRLSGIVTEVGVILAPTS